VKNFLEGRDLVRRLGRVDPGMCLVPVLLFTEGTSRRSGFPEGCDPSLRIVTLERVPRRNRPRLVGMFCLNQRRAPVKLQRPSFSRLVARKRRLGREGLGGAQQVSLCAVKAGTSGAIEDLVLRIWSPVQGLSTRS